MYPSVITTFTYPAASDRLNNPSHSALHNTTSSALGQVQAFVGLSTSSAVGTLVYDIRSPDSNGGGHVQSANKGGTGQTTYTKGDLLVAQSASVLTKVAIGTSGQILTVNSSTATGVEWGTAPARAKIAVSGSVITASSTNETSIMSVTIPGSTLGTNNTVRARLFATAIWGTTTNTLRLRANYGTTSVVNVVFTPPANATTSVQGIIDFNILGSNSVTSQLGIVDLHLLNNRLNPLAPSVLGVDYYQALPIYVNSSANQTLGVTAQTNGNDVSIVVNGFTVEKLD